MIPKSLVKLGRVAAAFSPSESTDWLPPLLGSSDDTPVPFSSSSTDADSEFDDSDTESDEDRRAHV